MYIYEARVVRWVDGDTVDVDIDLGFGLIFANQRIRLYGIDTPETRTRDLEEKQRGLAAKKYCEDYVPAGTKIKLKTHKEGKYGRILGEIIVTDGPVERNLNQLLVELQLAERFMV